MVVDVKKNINSTVSYKIVDYTMPHKVYVAIGTQSQIDVVNDQKVYKGQVIAHNKVEKFYSSVSGKILGVCSIKNHLNQSIQAIAIINDFKEHSKDIKEDFLTALNSYDTELYNIINLAKNNIIIVNLVEDEPLISNNIFIIRDFAEKILQTLDYLSTLLKLQQVILIVREDDKDIINKLWNVIGRYPNIDVKIVDNNYGYSFKKILSLKLQRTYDKFQIINLFDVIKLYNLYKKKKITTKKYITISGVDVVKPKVINVKYGTLLNEVIARSVKLKNKQHYYIVNGLMCGTQCDINSLCMGEEIKGIIITSTNPYEEVSCINCGLCTKVCPLKLDPKKIMENKEKNQVLSSCICCNLCSYICPAKIKITNYLKGGR